MSLYQDFLDKKNKEKSKPKLNENDSKKGIDSINQEKEEKQRNDFLKMVDGNQDQDEEINKKNEENSFSQKEKNFPPIPSAPIKEQKLWARILVVCLIIAGVAILAALVWYWAIKTPKIVTETIIEEKEIIKVVPELEPSFSFFQYDEFQDISITRSREASVYLKQYMAKDYNHNSLIKVSIRDHREKLEPEYISLESFFDLLGVDSPKGMEDKVIDQDFNLFIYSGDQNDIGFAFPVKKDEMTELLGIILATWDETMERDLSPFYSLAIPRGGEIAPPSTIYRGANIRCKGFRSAHHACFTPLDDILLITTSLESSKAVVDRSR